MRGFYPGTQDLFNTISSRFVQFSQRIVLGTLNHWQTFYKYNKVLNEHPSVILENDRFYPGFTVN